MLHKDAASLIGNTPVVELSRFTEGRPATVYAKVEFTNPGLSKKDRIARQIIDDAMARGELKPGMTVVERTSGNTGTGLAIVCAVRGLKFVAVISAGNTPERQKMMAALGARVEIVPQSPGSVPGKVTGDDLELVEQRAQQLTKELGAYRADQFNNPSNIKAHEEGTAKEIWDDLQGKIQAYCDYVGSSGTFVGTAKGLKRFDSSLKCFAVEPAVAPFLAGKTVTSDKHKIQGGGYAMRPPFWDESLVDGYLAVSDEEATNCARELASREGLFVGYSSAANIAGARKLAEQGLNTVCLINDTGLKYLSTDLWPEPGAK